MLYALMVGPVWAPVGIGSRMEGKAVMRRIVLSLRTLVLMSGVLPLATAEAAPAAASVPSDYEDTLVTNVFLPTALAWTPDGRMLVTTQPGQLQVYRNSTSLGTALDLNTYGGSDKVCSEGEQGLLGIAVDPAFGTNGHIYLYYTFKKPNVGCVNRVSRFTMSGDKVVAGSERALVTSRTAPATNHNAGDVQFGKDGMLYISVGDGGCDYAGNSGCAGANDAARDKHVLFGKILRIRKDGSIPSDNPWVSTGTARCNDDGQTSVGVRCQETFSWGLRNPFRMAFDPNNAGTRFFINDVGQNVWEEVNVGAKGADYGWNRCEGRYYNGTSTNCDNENRGMADPILNYNHNSGCASITGGAFVPNGLWPGSNGAYLYADYVCGKIFKRSATGAISTLVSGLGGSSAVHMAFGPSGSSKALYYTTYENGGEVRRLRYVGTANQNPVAQLSASPTYGKLPLAVAFDASRSSDPEGGTLSYEWDFQSDGTVDARTAKASYTYTSSRNYTVTLRVKDIQGAAALQRITIYAGNTPPSPKITAPLTTKLFQVGESIKLQGSATDAEDGTLAGTRLSWRVVRHHGTHTHPYSGPTEGASTTITGPAPEDLAATSNSYLMLHLTATDSRGLARTVAQRLDPRKVQLTFATSPTGLKLTVNSHPIVAPRILISWHGYRLTVSAPNQSGRVWHYWSDGGAQTHAIVSPASATTYTARYRLATTLTLSASPTTVNYNGYTVLTGYLRTMNGSLSGRTVYVWRSENGGTTWVRDSTANYNSTAQRYQATRTLTRNTLFRMQYAGDSTYQGASSGRVSVLSRASLSKPVTPTSVNRNTAFSAYGYLKPYHAGGTPLYFYRYVSGAWQLYGTVNATNAAYQDHTRYALESYALPTAGQWRVRALHQDASHATTWSPFQYFTVK